MLCNENVTELGRRTEMWLAFALTTYDAKYVVAAIGALSLSAYVLRQRDVDTTA